jgi:mono/diheme cytochrome c family protein
MRMLREASLWLLAVLAVLGTAARAAEVAAEANKALYLRYCGACHGPAGKGDGLAGSFMRPKPTDLTQIAKKNGGKFPFQGTMQAIDGTNTPRAHGDPDMPVWGEIFRAEATEPAGRRDETQRKLLQITAYVQSIQEQ